LTNPETPACFDNRSLAITEFVGGIRIAV